MKRIPMTSDAEKLFDEIDSLRVRLQGLREMRKDLETKLNDISLEIGEVRLQLVAKNDRFQQITESVAGTVPGPGCRPTDLQAPCESRGRLLDLGEAAMTITEMQQAIREAQAGMTNASCLMRQATERIHELETALNRMVLAHENLSSDTEGRYPPLDAGCLECTAGTTPVKYQTGPCAYHTAKKLLGQS